MRLRKLPRKAARLYTDIRPKKTVKKFSSSAFCVALTVTADLAAVRVANRIIS
jgi:hypothetical protein